MSKRNGDRSRFNRLNRQRLRRREKIAALLARVAAAAKS